jgi:UDP-glucose 4-epimerase
MIIVITGGNGFLGSNLAKKFLTKGHKVYIFDKSKNKFSLANKNAHQVNCDLTNYKTLEKLKINKVDLILHCAGQPSAALSFKDPEFDLKVNILGTLNILRWAKTKNVKKILFASTFNVYEENNFKPRLSENDNCKAKSLYAVSKIASENYIQCYANHYNLSWVILRMFNIFGPGQDPTNKSLGMINIFLNMAIKDNKVQVKGSLNRFRDFIFIDDVVEAWYQAAIKTKSKNKIYNIGTGKKTTILQLLKTISKVIKKKIQISELKGTPGDFNGCYSNISKIKRDLNFKPKVRLENGLKIFYHWAKNIK